ncbi:hypothetical protein WR25_11180 [Diploscapter pachys]|uniref:Uncharacterized protein n=1 Tax=Diploscapter pachys TaxID=2018661 RepID=A0A2A2JYN6_9BILA|nr:hypothetical protein WR25_11180 [Diploscapter pachys]
MRQFLIQQHLLLRGRVTVPPGDDFGRSFSDDEEDARDPAIHIPKRAVRVREEGFLRHAVAIRRIAAVLDEHRFARQHAIEDRRQLVPHLRPPCARRLSQHPRVLAAEDARIGIVVDGEQLRPPMHHHRKGRGQYDLNGGLQGCRPAERIAERMRDPVDRPQRRRAIAPRCRER